MRSAAAAAGSLRRVATHNTASRSRLSARYSSTVRVSGSAQCRSSSIMSSPAGSARRRSNWRTASPRTAGPKSTAACSPRSADAGSAAGMTAWRAPSQGARPASAESGRPRRAWSRASVSGRYGLLLSLGTARPTRTVAPSARAAAASSPASRDLPIPGSPQRKTTPPAPAPAVVRADRSTAVSALRPMTRGQRRPAIRSVCAGRLRSQLRVSPDAHGREAGRR